MRDLFTEYDTIKSEVDQMIGEFYELSDENEDINELCFGWRVFFSPLMYNPDILFIGINPGSGLETIDLEYSNKDQLEYLNFNYALARETKKVFGMANRPHLLEKSVKTNYYYLSTQSEKKLYKLTDLMGNASPNALRERFFDKSKEWTRKLITAINPKLVICEGKSSFVNTLNCLNKSIQMNFDCQLEYYHEIPIIGYKRYFSRILDKKSLSQMLMELT